MGRSRAHKIIAVFFIVLLLVGNIHALEMEIFPEKGSASQSMETGEFWALVFHFQPFKGWVCDREIEEILTTRGWQKDHIRIFEGDEITRKNFFDSFSWLDEQEQEGDTILFFYNGPGHKGGIKLYDNEYYVAYPELDDLFDNLESTSISIVLDA